MIAIVDYGMGNLRSVQKALEFIGERVQITSDAADIFRADRVILPGVGAFRDAIQALHEKELSKAFVAAVNEGKPALGICLGMQLLFEQSDEFGQYAGLGLLPGRITRIQSRGQKIPHIGWNRVEARGDSPLLRGMDSAYFYFVHSLCAQDAQSSHVAGVCQYGESFAALVHHKNLHGAQFHPEKSGEAGLMLLRNFAAL